MVRLLATFDKPGDYVWHCHIVSHEDNSMMRPLAVMPSSQTVCRESVSSTYAVPAD
jgi:spore coat protein A, manganese oxidase